MRWYLGLISRHLVHHFTFIFLIYCPRLYFHFPRSLFPRSFYPRSLFFLIRHDVRFMTLRLLRKPFSLVIFDGLHTQEHFGFIFPSIFLPRLLFSPIRHDSTFARQTFLTRLLFWRASHASQEHSRLSILFFYLCPWNTILLQRSALTYWMLFMTSYCPGALFQTISSSAVIIYNCMYPLCPYQLICTISILKGSELLTYVFSYEWAKYASNGQWKEGPPYQ